MVEDGKFKELIKESYKRWQGGNITGTLYTALQTYGFSQITDIDELVGKAVVDMMHLKSMLTDTEIDVYEWDLEDYKVKHSESTIYIKLKNRPEIGIMY